MAKQPAETRSLPKGRLTPGTVVLVPLVSEKSTRLQQQGQYTFAVAPNVTKIDVKKAVEVMFGVKVVGVNATRLPRKTVRRGRTRGTTRIRRHIVVRLTPGQSIDLAKLA